MSYEPDAYDVPPTTPPGVKLGLVLIGVLSVALVFVVVAAIVRHNAARTLQTAAKSEPLRQTETARHQPGTDLPVRGRETHKNDRAGNDSPAPAPKKSVSETGAFHGVVYSHLRRSVNDADGLEVVEWGQPSHVIISPPGTMEGFLLDVAGEASRLRSGIPKPPLVAKGEALRDDYAPGVILGVTWREKGRSEAKVIRNAYFLVQDGKVTRTSPRNIANPPSDDIPWAETLGFIGAERIGEKYTRVIVRGKLSHGGRDLTMSQDPSLERVSVALSKENARYGPKLDGVTMPPRFEFGGVPPGKYYVSVQWFETGLRTPRDNNSATTVDRLDRRYAPENTPVIIVVNDREPIQRADLGLVGELNTTKLHPGYQPFAPVRLP